MTQRAADALCRNRAVQPQERLLAGSMWKDGDLVFANQLRRFIDAADLRREHHRVLAAAGVPRIRFHDLRHTAATLMLGRGVHPKVASEMLGHSTIGITLDLYSHASETMQREAARTVDTLFRE